VVNPSDASFANKFDGIVRELIYLGDHIRVRLSVCGVDNFVVKIPNTQNEKAMTVGQIARVGWRLDACSPRTRSQ
jgi:putative spermidine/putrescine transport system ATP-binding protein